MRRAFVLPFVAATAMLLVMAVPGEARHQSRGGRFAAQLDGYQEVPSISTEATGTFRATPITDGLRYSLSYSALSAPATAAHIHFGQAGVNGGVMIWLCGGGGRPPCPETGGTVSGDIFAEHVVGPAGQGMPAGDLEQALRAMRAGVTYANVHSNAFPGGEIRGLIR